MHVAQTIVRHVNENFEFSSNQTGSAEWRITDIKSDVSKLIRLGALLHDIGHLPFGHTLEDELHHLRSHDGAERLLLIGNEKYPHYYLDKSIGSFREPADGWSLRELVNVLYHEIVASLQITLEPFDVLCAIICKPPKNEGRAKDKWEKDSQELERKLDLQVCRDVVGNTICADFLDYLFRDWYHLGKPLYEDKRLYQYMEARTKTGSDKRTISRFVINVGQADRIRHDALTNILELLENRYKLAETVLFHRTKLALTALLDRCLLEIRDLYKVIGFSNDVFLDTAERHFLTGSDDELASILRQLASGGDGEVREKLQARIQASRAALAETIKPKNKGGQATDLLTSDRDTPSTAAKTDVEIKIREISTLIDRLRDREIYTLAYKVKISDFTGPHTPDNARLNRLIELYRDPENRRRYLLGMEARCNLPTGSLVFYCPPNASMNAKIAKVNLLIDGDVTPFDAYDREGQDSSLTRGALWAQIRRFLRALERSSLRREVHLGLANRGR